MTGPVVIKPVKATLEEVRALHESWGDTPSDLVDHQQLWEDLGRILGVLPS